MADDADALHNDEGSNDDVDALVAVYGDECVVRSVYPLVVEVQLKPYTADDSSEQFVEVTAVFETPPTYPSVLPQISLERVKGLGDERADLLLRGVRERLLPWRGMPMMVAACEEIRSLLTDMNCPQGSCCFCQEGLTEEDKNERLPDEEETRGMTPSPLDAPKLMKLQGCFHCFHLECLVGWVSWSIENHQQQRQQEEEKKAAMGWQQRKRKEDEEDILECVMRTLSCPVCRTTLSPLDLQRLKQQVPFESEAVDDQREDSDAEDEEVQKE